MSENEPKVSVIVPTYNRAPLLRACLDSVLSQDFRDFTVTVVDDGSTDETQTILSHYASQVACLPIPHTGLPGVARNRGLLNSRSEYISFLDSDDLWRPGKLSWQVETLERHKDFMLVCSNALLFDGEGPHVPYLKPEHGHSGWVLDSLLLDNFIITSSVTTRRSILDKVGVFSEDRELRGCEDYDLWLRIAAVGKVWYDPEPLIVYRRHSDSLSKKRRVSEHWKAINLVYFRLKSFLQHDLGHRDLSATHKQQLFSSLVSLCRAYAREKRYLHLAKTASLMLLTQPRRASLRVLRVSVVQPFQAGDVKLHLGCCEKYLPGYINVDFPPDRRSLQRSTRADLFADLTTISFKPDSVDEIRLHHVFEHFDRPTALKLLIGWYSWLKEEGRLIIETPDFEKCVREFLHSDRAAQSKLLRHLFGSHEAEWAMHKDGWYEAKFKFCLTGLGFEVVSVSRSSWQGTHNITVTALKRGPSRTRSELLRSAEKLLRLNLIDRSESEQALLERWMENIRSSEHEDPAHG